MTEALLLTLKVATAVIIFAVGLGTRMRDVTYLLGRPALLGRSLFAMYLLVPLLAWLLGRLFDLSDGIRLALVIFAISAGAPLLPRKLAVFGSDEYVFSLVVVTTIIGILLVPPALVLLGPAFGSPLRLDMAYMAWTFAKALFLPLAAGLLVRVLLPARADAASDPLMKIAGAVLSLAGLALLLLHGSVLAEVRFTGVVALATFLALSLLIGHACGGPDPGDRTALAVACATRHLGIAIIVATSVPGPRAAVLVSAYVLVAAVVSLIYLRLRRARTLPKPS